MAGRGPAPGANPNSKPPHQRRGRNSGPQFEELPSRHDGPYPRLPPSYSRPVGRAEVTQTKFLVSTRRWYEAWATSPMASEWTQVHFLRLFDVAVLQDRFSRGEHELASELRLQLAGFGGTPMDLRRMGKKIGGEESAAPVRQSTQRPRLRAV